MRINIYKRVHRWSSLLDSSSRDADVARKYWFSHTASRNEKYKEKDTEERGRKRKI